MGQWRMDGIVKFLRKLFRAYSDGLRHAGYPETYSGRYLARAEEPWSTRVPPEHLRVMDVPPRTRVRLG